GLGIDLRGDGVSANDSGDRDSGPNLLQNYPILTDAKSSSSSTTVKGKLDSTPRTTYTIQLFSSATCDPSRFGEGRIFLGSTVLTTNGGGSASLNVTLPGTTTTGDVITATATDPAGNTSEFSNCQTVASSKTVTALAARSAQRADLTTRHRHRHRQSDSALASALNI